MIVQIKDIYSAFQNAHKPIYMAAPLNAFPAVFKGESLDPYMKLLSDQWKEIYDIEIELSTTMQGFYFGKMIFKDEAQYAWFLLKWA